MSESGPHPAAVRRRKWLLVPVVVVLLLIAMVVRFSPLWPGPALPAGATRLHIVTAPAHLVPDLGCPVALMAPGRIADQDGELVLLSVATGESIKVVWPSGWAAWQVDGRATLVDREGGQVAREGDVLNDLGGGVGADDVFHVCMIGG